MKDLIDYIELHTKAVLVFFFLAVISFWFLQILVWKCVSFFIKVIYLHKNRKNMEVKDGQEIKFPFINDKTTTKNFIGLFGDFLFDLINDFKHFLALIVVLVFFILLITTVFLADTNKDRMDSIQVIAGSLGGLIGSIIGYYFGEASTKKLIAAKATKGNASGGNSTPDNSNGPVDPLTTDDLKK